MDVVDLEDVAVILDAIVDLLLDPQARGQGVGIARAEHYDLHRNVLAADRIAGQVHVAETPPSKQPPDLKPSEQRPRLPDRT